MNAFELMITVLTFLAVTLQLFNWWSISKGKLSTTYVLSIIVNICTLIIDVSIAANNKVLWSIYLFAIVNLWAITMSIKGLLRLKKDKLNAN